MIYLDNACTAWPKAPGVSDRMKYYLDCVGASINRSVYAAAQTAGIETLRLREQLSRFFHHDSPSRVLLTGGATAALNLAIKGYLRPDDHVLVSGMEHNAVMRPLVQLGLAFDRIPCDSFGRLLAETIPSLLRKNTRMLILCHASNVCGTIQDAAAVGRICQERGIALLLDGAQSAGHLPIDFLALGLSALAIPAHKGLLGPQGIGALLVSEDFAAALNPLIAGGTGSMSDSEQLPPYLPDRFESGTLNLPGIYGWAAAMDYLEEVGLSSLMARESALTARLLDGLRTLDGLRVIGLPSGPGRVGVVAVDCPGRDNAELADRLEQEFGILTRCGLHCAPAAHRSLGTYPQGVIRFSPGHATAEADVEAVLQALHFLLG